MGRGTKALAEIAKQLEAKKRKVKPKAVKAAPVVPIDEFTARHGAYVRDGTKLRNAHVDTVARWKSMGLISETQARAIELCQDLWERAGSPPGLVMDLLKIPGMPGGTGASQHDALRQLAEMRDGFKPPVDTYFDVFENVVRWNEPGGVAGSRWANDDGRASQSALMCVRFVADMIAMWRRL